MVKKGAKPPVEVQDEPETISEPTAVQQLELELQQARERERRSLADYQNLIKRTQDDRSKMATYANRELLESLLQPLEHLSLAAQQLKDAGLDMVVSQLWRSLNQVGLTEIETVGKSFDPLTMEVVDKGEKSEVVLKEVTKGYKLHGTVLQHAKVILD